MTDDPERSSQTDTPEGPEKDPQSYEVGATDDPDKDPAGSADERADGMQNASVHDGATADDRPDTNEGADARVEIQQPDGETAPVAED